MDELSQVLAACFLHLRLFSSMQFQNLDPFLNLYSAPSKAKIKVTCACLSLYQNNLRNMLLFNELLIMITQLFSPYLCDWKIDVNYHKMYDDHSLVKTGYLSEKKMSYNCMIIMH
jgi:hypothetical protein